MKRTLLALCAISSLTAVTLVAPPVFAHPTISERHGVVTTTRTVRKGKQIEKVTCREFLGLQQQFQPQAVSYAIGYDKARKPEDAVLDIAGISRIVPVVQKSCRTTPQLTLIQRIRADLHKL